MHVKYNITPLLISASGVTWKGLLYGSGKKINDMLEQANGVIYTRYSSGPNQTEHDTHRKKGVVMAKNPQYSKQARKFLDKQGEPANTRIRNAVNKIPFGDIEKYIEEPGTYRLRVGNYRVLFTKENHDIFVRKIDNRGQVYKK